MSIGARNLNYLIDPNASWMPIVKQVLGDDCKLIHAGVMLSMADSRNQPYHSDGK